jgi:excisionase family DNA binding protein
MRIHTTLAGHRIEYPEPDPKLERFLKRVRTLAEDPNATEDELIALVYGADNPILDHAGLFPGRGAVTREVLDNPVYHVLTDFIARKRVASEGLDVKRLAAKYTVSVPEAAEQLGVHTSAIYKAIQARRLPSWVKDGQHFLDPASLASFQVGTRGPVARDVEPLEYCAGYEAGSMLQIRYPRTAAAAEAEEPEDRAPTTGTIKRWRRVGVLTGAKGKLRFFILEPGPEPNEIAFHTFYVRGKFGIAEKINNAKLAREAWDAFKPT